jgi:mannose-6-phosphate isomerase-like protein (cupin superfamily)
MDAGTNFPFQVVGQARAEALAYCRAVIRGWGLTMPPGEPLVLDFGLGRFDEVGEIEFWVANEEAHGYCGKFLFVADGQTCPYHRHDRKHETFFVLKGRVRMIVDSVEKVLDEGDATRSAPLVHRCRACAPVGGLDAQHPARQLLRRQRHRRRWSDLDPMLNPRAV